MKEIDEYTNVIFGESTQPKPKNWSRKTLNCKCNIPIFEKSTDNVLGRIDIEYIVEPHNKTVMLGGYSKLKWWMSAKPKKWEVTHLKSYGFDDIEHSTHMGYVERGGALTPSPIYITVEDVNKYNTMILKQERRKKLKQLNN